jgi:hypothetical protein
MSLLFEYAVDQFDLNDAALVSADPATLPTTEADIPVQPITGFATMELNTAQKSDLL